MALRILLGRFTSPPFLSTSLLTCRPLLLNPIRTIITTNPEDVRLNNLRDNPGAVKRKMRIGRGIGTGVGKTSKRGHKGQKSRTGRGKPMPGSVGGAKPMYKSMRKYGFKNTRFARRLEGLNLDALQHHINNRTINPYKTITIKEIYDAQCLGPRIREGVKLLARGADTLTTRNLHVEVNDCSAAARDAIEKLGGKVDLVYHNRISLRYTVKPEKFYLKPKFARPPPKLHASKYPNFPAPTPFAAQPQVLEDLEYAPDFTEKLKAEKKARVEKLKVAVRTEKKTRKQERKDKAIALAKDKESTEGETAKGKATKTTKV